LYQTYASYMVELVGVEPTSKGIFQAVSTCLVLPTV